MAIVTCPYCKKKNDVLPGTIKRCKCGAKLHITSNGTLGKKEPPRK